MLNKIKNHADTITVLAAIAASFLWMNNKFNQIDKDLAVIKTVMILKGIMTPDLIAKNQSQNNENKDYQ